MPIWCSMSLCYHENLVKNDREITLHLLSGKYSTYFTEREKEKQKEKKRKRERIQSRNRSVATLWCFLCVFCLFFVYFFLVPSFTVHDRNMIAFWQRYNELVVFGINRCFFYIYLFYVCLCVCVCG